MGQEIDGLARFIAATRREEIPEPVQRHAKMVLLDTLGVILAGSERPELRALRPRLAGTDGAGVTVYARGAPAAEAKTAALLNGIAGRAIELCEGLRLVSGQAAMQILPGLLAVAEQGGYGGRDMMAALVLGYEAAARLAARFRPRPLAHQNGQVPLLAAAAAGARVRGFDADGIGRGVRSAPPQLL
jgi:2-methylcitrate dehydratase PrpD